MDYSVKDLIEGAKVCLDENVSSEALTGLDDIDTLKLDEIIRSKVEDAARLVEEGAAHWLLDGDVLSGPITWETGRTSMVGGHIALDSTFLRLLTFKMSDWSRPVIEAITEESPLYELQASRYGGVRGNPEQPVVAITHGENGLQLEFYSCMNTSATISRAKYVKLPVIHTVNSRDMINICSRLVSAITYRIASMTADSVGESALSQVLLAKSNELAGIES